MEMDNHSNKVTDELNGLSQCLLTKKDFGLSLG